MHHLEAVVVKRRSKKAGSPPSTFCHTTRDIQTEFVRKSGCSLRSVGRRWQDMIVPNREDPRNLRKSGWDQKLGKIECVFSSYDKMRWCLSTPGSPKYIPRVAHYTSIAIVSPYTHRRCRIIYLEVVIERVWRCIWRAGSSKPRDIFWGHGRTSFEMQFVADNGWTQTCVRCSPLAEYM
jgi:hypothetical protein